jgi:hypothetical protein
MGLFYRKAESARLKADRKKQKAQSSKLKAKRKECTKILQSLVEN